MTNQEILTKAIEKAIAGGWDWELIDAFPFISVMPLHRGTNIKGESFNFALENNPLAPAFIFDHDFAKSLWPMSHKYHLGLIDKELDYRNGLPIWQYHLQQMVIAGDPIKYLGENIE